MTREFQVISSQEALIESFTTPAETDQDTLLNAASQAKFINGGPNGSRHLNEEEKQSSVRGSTHN